MIKVLFLIHDLGQGGAEKVLVNLVNHMDLTKFDISVIALFGGGVNEQFLRPEIRYHSIFQKAFPGNSHVMKIFSPEYLHKWFIKEKYDVEISYLEGPAARIISGCSNPNTKLVSWIHCTMSSSKDIAESFRSAKEAEACYNAMDKIVFVSEEVRKAFLKNCSYKGSTEVLYNTVESSRILRMSHETVDEIVKDKIGLVAVGTLKPVKGFDRLLRVVKRLHEEAYPIRLYLLGVGPQQKELEQFISQHFLEDVVSLLGYQTNPYKYVAKCDLFVCSSFSEGFSTVVTESLIVGTPVCTVDVSGMREMLGDNNQYGIVTDNSEEALYQGVKKLLNNRELLQYYKKQAQYRGYKFETKSTVEAVENLFIGLLDNKNGET